MSHQHFFVPSISKITLPKFENTFTKQIQENSSKGMEGLIPMLLHALKKQKPHHSFRASLRARTVATTCWSDHRTRSMARPTTAERGPSLSRPRLITSWTSGSRRNSPTQTASTTQVARDRLVLVLTKSGKRLNLIWDDEKTIEVRIQNCLI